MNHPIPRSDEEKVLGTNQPTVNYTGLVKCDTGYGFCTDGIQCSDECKDMEFWCADTGDVCKTPGGDIVSLDTPALCRNSSYWRINNFSCNWYRDGLVWGAGVRCTGDFQHCSWPWYRWYGADTGPNPTCVDKSDQVFPINTTCSQFNKQLLQTYRSLWCSGNKNRYTGSYCDNLDDRFAEQDIDKITDPHGCIQSCKSTNDGPDCLACEHPDFFHCNSTGLV